MSKNINKNSITISRKNIQKKGGMVVLSLEEYEELRMTADPVFQLHGKAARDLDKLIKDGMRDYEMGKTRTFKEFLKKEHPKLYEDYKN